MTYERPQGEGVRGLQVAETYGHELLERHPAHHWSVEVGPPRERGRQITFDVQLCRSHLTGSDRSGRSDRYELYRRPTFPGCNDSAP